jgi:hypothetical protein
VSFRLVNHYKHLIETVCSHLGSLFLESAVDLVDLVDLVEIKELASPAALEDSEGGNLILSQTVLAERMLCLLHDVRQSFDKMVHLLTSLLVDVEPLRGVCLKTMATNVYQTSVIDRCLVSITNAISWCLIRVRLALRKSWETTDHEEGTVTLKRVRDALDGSTNSALAPLLLGRNVDYWSRVTVDRLRFLSLSHEVDDDKDNDDEVQRVDRCNRCLDGLLRDILVEERILLHLRLSQDATNDWLKAVHLILWGGDVPAVVLSSLNRIRSMDAWRRLPPIIVHWWMTAPHSSISPPHQLSCAPTVLLYWRQHVDEVLRMTRSVDTAIATAIDHLVHWRCEWNRTVGLFNTSALIEELDEATRVALSVCTDASLECSRQLDVCMKAGDNRRDGTATIKSLVCLVSCLSDKARFEVDFCDRVGARLLERCTLVADERDVLQRLKVACGGDGTWTSRIERMCTESELAPTSVMLSESVTVVASVYSQWLSPMITKGVLCRSAATVRAMAADAEIGGGGAGGGVTLSSSSSLPLFPLPEPLNGACEAMEAEYVRNNPAYGCRRLGWCVEQGTVEMNVDGGSTTLVCSTLQMLVLLCFGDHGGAAVIKKTTTTTKSSLPLTLTLSELLVRTHMSTRAAQLIQQLLTLAHPQVALLLKYPPCTTVALTDHYQWNPAFQSHLSRFVVPTFPRFTAVAVWSTTMDVLSSVDAATFLSSDRRWWLDALVIRVMKVKRRCVHSELLSEVADQWSRQGRWGPVVLSVIKQRIECCIEQDYLSRDELDRTMMVYMP